MGMRNPVIYSWLAQGLSDNREPMSAQVGDCRVVQNLIHDPTSKGVLAPRPGVTLITNFAGFATPGVVSLTFTVGPRIYGMLATGRNVGYDEPFCYDTSINAFVTIGGVTSGNVPQTQPSTAPGRRLKPRWWVRSSW